MAKVYYVQDDGYYAAPDYEAFKLGLLDLVGQEQAEEDLRDRTVEVSLEDTKTVKVSMVDEGETPTQQVVTLHDLLKLHLVVNGLVFGQIASESW